MALQFIHEPSRCLRARSHCHRKLETPPALARVKFKTQVRESRGPVPCRNGAHALNKVPKLTLQVRSGKYARLRNLCIARLDSRGLEEVSERSWDLGSRVGYYSEGALMGMAAIIHASRPGWKYRPSNHTCCSAYSNRCGIATST